MKHADQLIRRIVWLLLTLVLPPVSIRAEIDTPKAYEIKRSDGALKIDGLLDESVWKNSAPMPLLVETWPADNTAPPVRTDAYLAYDDKNVYVAIKAFDPDPKKIRAHVSDRDHAYSDDFAGIVLDTFNDGRRAFEFFVNPYGVQMDLFQNDVGGGEDDSWDAIWDSAGKVSADGYTVEMAIPFSSLRFPPGASVQTWGVDILRIYPRDQRHRIGLNRLPRDLNCYVCAFAKVSGF